MPVAHVNDIDIYYELAGDGPRLLVLPGSGADLRVANAGKPLQDRFTVLTLDQRGLGQTSAPQGPYSMAQYADDVAGLLDHLGWEHCHVLGISFGGMVAQEVALRHPQRIDRLVLACSSPGGAGGSSAPLHEYERLPVDEQGAVRMQVQDRRHDAAWRAAHADEVAAFHERIVRAQSRPPEARRGSRLQLEARAEHDTFDRLHLITAPTLVAGGRHDGQAPQENQRAIATRIPGARLEFFEGGHGFIREDPEAYDALADFLLNGSAGA